MPNERNAQALALAAMGGLAVVAILSSRPAPGGRETIPGGSGADEAGLSRPTFVSPETLSGFIMRRAAVRIVDLREPEAYAAFHLPGAVNASPSEIVSAAGETVLGPPGDQEIVLCSDDMLDPFEVTVDLIRKGYTHAHVLEGGLDRFQAEILTPPSLRGVLSEARAKEERPLHAARRRFYLEGGHSVAGLARDPEAISEPTLVSSAWLERSLDRVVPVDVRTADEFAAGRVPGAVHLPQEGLRATRDGVPQMLLESERLAKMVGDLGVSPEDSVALYGAELRDAALGAMAFLRLGHRKVAVVEATWADWLAEGRPVSTSPAARPPRAYAPVAGADDFTVATARVLDAATKRSAVIVDVRSPEEYRGETNAVAGRAGRIPGAVSRDYRLDLAGGQAAGRFRPAEELLSEYAKVGATPDKPIIISCQSGHRASQTYYLLRHLLGFRSVSWYDGSWKAWGADKSLPLESGPPAS